MNAKDIMSKKFSMCFRGYNVEEVEGFLQDVCHELSRVQKENEDLKNQLTFSHEISRLQKENEDLKSKLEVLAK